MQFTNLYQQAFQATKANHQALSTDETLEQRANGFTSMMREERHRLARKSSWYTRWSERVDQACATEELEYMDVPNYSQAAKLRIAQGVHLSNQVTFCYQRFFRYLQPLIEEIHQRTGRPARLLELASGVGGFAIELSKQAQKHRLPVEIVGSDVVPLYIETANRQAQKLSLPVHFERIDALRLQSFPRPVFDIIVIAQSLHHFSPGQIAQMMAGAQNAATTAFVGLDGYRSWHMLTLVPLSALFSFQKDTIHDAWLTARKFYPMAELETFARLAVPNAEIDVHRAAGINTIISVRFDRRSQGGKL
jgi:2-polyprenyl-3-methyl-5-hydroxy-6-metoxy-1,4-benzoquinol methylase